MNTIQWSQTLLNSYVRFMKEHLFNHIDILPENCDIPDGNLQKDEIAEYCADYEAKIKAYGGLDLQVLGIGGTILVLTNPDLCKILELVWWL